VLNPIVLGILVGNQILRFFVKKHIRPNCKWVRKELVGSYAEGKEVVAKRKSGH